MPRLSHSALRRSRADELQNGALLPLIVFAPRPVPSRTLPTFSLEPGAEFSLAYSHDAVAVQSLLLESNS